MIQLFLTSSGIPPTLSYGIQQKYTNASPFWHPSILRERSDRFEEVGCWGGVLLPSPGKFWRGDSLVLEARADINSVTALRHCFLTDGPACPGTGLSTEGQQVESRIKASFLCSWLIAKLDPWHSWCNLSSLVFDTQFYLELQVFTVRVQLTCSRTRSPKWS